MSKPIAFEGHNIVLNAPKGQEETVLPLPIFRNGVCCVSCWQLSEEELADIVAAGGKIFISIFSGRSQPPVYVGSETTVRGICADYGVWKR